MYVSKCRPIIKEKQLRFSWWGWDAVSNHHACRCVERSVMGLLCKGGAEGLVGDKSLFDGAAVWTGVFVVSMLIERERERAAVGKATPEVLITGVCVRPGCSSWAQRACPLTASTRSDTTLHCVATRFTVERLSRVDWRWEINQPQLKGRRKKENNFILGWGELEEKTNLMTLDSWEQMTQPKHPY